MKLTILLLLIFSILIINVNCLFIKNSNKNVVGFYTNNLKNKTINYKSLGKLCQDGNYDTIVIGTLTWSPNFDSLNFDSCKDNNKRSNDMISCDEMKNDIQICKKIGINMIIQVSGGVNTIKNKSNAIKMAKKINDMFLFGLDCNSPRPFGNEIYLDGVDLSPLVGKSEGYLDLARELSKFKKPTRNFLLTSTVDCSLLHSIKEGPSVSNSILNYQYFDFLTLDFVHNKECDYWSKVSDQWILDFTQFTVDKTNNQTKLLLMASSNTNDSSFFSPKFFLMEYTKYCIHLPNMAGVYLSDISLASKIVNYTTGIDFGTEISKSIKYYDPNNDTKPKGSRPPCSYTNTC